MLRILIIRGGVRFFLFLTLATHAFGAGIGSYTHLVVADSPGAARDGVRVTYLGTNGYQFEFKGHALLVDPLLLARGPFERSTWFAHSTKRLPHQRRTAQSPVRQPPEGRDSGDARTL